MIETSIRDFTKDKKYSLQFLPKSIENLSKEKFTNFNGKDLKNSYLIDIVHNLILRYFFKKENSFNLSSLILKEKYGAYYNYYMNYLVKNKILLISKEYLKGTNARIYRLNSSIIEEEILRYKNADSTILKKYKKKVSSVEEQDLSKNSILPEIKQKIVSDLFSVNINVEKAMYYLDNTIQDSDSYNKNKYSVESINDKHIFYHFDSYGRFHTNFTILKSFIRKNCLLIDEEETWEKDLSNSQPLLLSKLIKEEAIFIEQEEFQLYCKLVSNGGFYQFMMDKIGLKEKAECKKIIYKTFFGKNSKNNPFSIIFPSIYKFIVEYKESFSNYKILAYKLQEMESELIFNKIIKTLMIINPDIKFITIHDSIIVQSKYKDITEKIFNSIINSEIINYQ